MIIINTPLETVYDSFMQKTTDYKLLELSQEDYYSECLQLLKGALARFVLADDITIDSTLNEFNRELTLLEIDILSLGMVIHWVSPKINSIELMKMSLGSRDYQMYSQANHIKELLEMKNEANREFSYWITQYSSKKALEELKKL